jgi:hypothetical protein
MDGLSHFKYIEEFIEDEIVFHGRIRCTCSIGKAHWQHYPVKKEPQDKEKVDEHSNTGLLDEDSSSA